MTLRRTLVAAVFVVAAFPGTASSGEVRLVPRDEPLAAARDGAARPAPAPFNMVGIHWRGPGAVWFRTAAERGVWSTWRPARPEEEDAPDAGSVEATSADGWKVGNPWWTGDARWIQYRVSGEVRRLRTFFIASPVAASDAPARTASALTAALAKRPPIVSRARWGADESIVRGGPVYASRVRLSVVHHTAGTNTYSASQSAAIVRGIQRYHVVGNGWNDIGYNFLVDKYGQIFEGRAGGLARNVIGAHAQGFNTGSVGVAVLGTYDGVRIPAAGRSALERLLAWRLDVAHVDPVSLLTYFSYGNPRFPAGTAVRLRAVSGHRDTGYTSCPGPTLYGELGAIATAVSKIGLPKLYEPKVTGGLGGPVRFTGRLSSARPWSVTVRDGAGAVAARGSGSGTAVDWTWDSSKAPAGAYRYTMAAGDDVRPASGSVPAPPPLAVTGLRVSPAALTPNGDGSGERTRVVFTLSRRATVRVEVRASGAVVRTLAAAVDRPAGPTRLSWAGTRDDGRLAPDGRYRVRVTAAAPGEEVARSVVVVVDRTLGWLTVTPPSFSPNADGRLDDVAFGFLLARPADVRVRVVQGGRTIARVLSGSLAGGAQTTSWSGRAGGVAAPDGVYEARVEATTTLGTRRLSRTFTLDNTRPWLRILSVEPRERRTRVRFALSEAARVRIRYGTEVWNVGGARTITRGAGVRRVLLPVGTRAVRMVAWDAAENRSRARYARG
jgi:hypothetical protein